MAAALRTGVVPATTPQQGQGSAHPAGQRGELVEPTGSESPASFDLTGHALRIRHHDSDLADCDSSDGHAASEEPPTSPSAEATTAFSGAGSSTSTFDSGSTRTTSTSPSAPLGQDLSCDDICARCNL
eukprot:scaffold606930_cov41-Prasinocladus_malaysianus.AAC.1